MDILLIVALGALLIFFMFNSRKKQRQRQESLSAGLTPGAKVMTSFGVFGTVVDVDMENNKVTIESNPGTVLTVHRQAIGNVESPGEAADEQAESADADLPSDAQVPDDISSLSPAAGTAANETGEAAGEETEDMEAEDSTADAADDDADTEVTDGAEQEMNESGSAGEDREDGTSDSTRG